MKRKIIETSDTPDLVCDNPKCDFVYDVSANEDIKDMDIFINYPCPECGQNLLTQEDYDNYKNLERVVNWINKWFGWIALFYRKKAKRNESQIYKVHCHDGIKIKKESKKK